MPQKTVLSLFGLLMFAVVPSPLRAQEGMWPLNQLPTELLEKTYGFTPTPEWITRVQRGAIRLPNCSASFVSAYGLVMTNGHCAEEAVQALSTAENNFYESGFYAPTRDKELKTGLALMQLQSIEDVTREVNDAVANAMNSGVGNPAVARRGAIEQIQTASSQTTGLTCEIVILYQGGQYHNYCYKTYTDVRLVFSTEKQTWFFGGDADNFEYPRYNLDVSFLRAYENGKPAETPHHFTWSASGASESSLVFMAGHPGRTDRMYTTEALKTERDVKAPFILDLVRRLEITYQQFALEGPEANRITESELFSWQNARKLYVGKVRGLQDQELFARRAASEAKLIADAESKDPALAAQVREGITLVAETQPAIRELYPKVLLVASGYGFNSTLFDYAVNLLADPEEAKKEIEGRKDLSPLELRLEWFKLTDALTFFAETYGAENPFVTQVLSGKGPADRARELIYDTRLGTIKGHRALADAGTKAVNDPIVSLAGIALQAGEELQREYGAAVEKERQGYAKIADAIFKLYGTEQYPDATFTLRLAFGKVQGYEEYGEKIAPWTTLDGAYQHAEFYGNAFPWTLSERWLKNKKRAELDAPLNFVATLDITGGNSGSPVFNEKLEIVGLAFDSNIHGLVSDYDYNYDPRARAILVHSAGIVEALRSIYGAKALVSELLGSN